MRESNQMKEKSSTKVKYQKLQKNDQLFHSKYKNNEII